MTARSDSPRTFVKIALFAFFETKFEADGLPSFPLALKKLTNRNFMLFCFVETSSRLQGVRTSQNRTYV